MQSRRAFIGSAAAAGAGAIGLTGANQWFAPAVSAQTTDDPIGAELARQLDEATKGLLNRPGENLRKVAAALRLGAVHYRSKGADQEFDRALRQAIRQRGRDAIIGLSPGAGELNAIAKSMGLSSFPQTPFDYSARSAGLDAVLKVGLTTRLTQMAATLEQHSRDVDTVMGPVKRVGYDAQTCTILYGQSQSAQNYIAVFCPLSAGLAVLGSWVAAPTCVFYTSYLAGISAQIIMFC